MSIEQLRGKARDAALGGWESVAVMSTGERLAVALICNRADWLDKMDYSIADALRRAGEWADFVPKIASELEADA